MIETFFKRRRRILIQSSTIQGKHWSSLNLVKSIFLIISLVVFVSSQDTITTGQVVSIYTYINRFLGSLMSIPIGIESWTRMKDITNRIT